MGNAWMEKHQLQSRLPGKIAIASDTQMTHPYGRKRRGAKEEVKEASGKAGLKLNIQSMKTMAFMAK